MQVQPLTNAANLPLVSLQPVSTQLQLIPDPNIATGRFKADLLQPQRYYAHPITIRAVRKEIFSVGDCLEDLALEYACSGCKKMLDWQFWHFCPHCETAMPQEFKNPKLSIS
jgi:hypothetical protein